MSNLPKILFRRTTAQYAKKFVEEGIVVFKSLAAYRKYEEEKLVRIGDINEGSYASIKGPGEIAIDKGGGKFIAPLVGNIQIGLSIPDPQNYLILSMSSETHVDQLSYGNMQIRLFDPEEFLRRLINSFPQILHGPVDYYKPAEWSPEKSQDFDYWKLKRDVFSTDFEYRFCAKLNSLPDNCGISTVNVAVVTEDSAVTLLGTASALELKLGSLSDIAEIVV